MVLVTSFSFTNTLSISFLTWPWFVLEQLNFSSGESSSGTVSSSQNMCTCVAVYLTLHGGLFVLVEKETWLLPLFFPDVLSKISEEAFEAAPKLLRPVPLAGSKVDVTCVTEC